MAARSWHTAGMERFEVRPAITWSGNRYWTVVDLESPSDVFPVVEAYGQDAEDVARGEANRLNNLEPGQDWFPWH